MEYHLHLFRCSDAKQGKGFAKCILRNSGQLQTCVPNCCIFDIDPVTVIESVEALGHLDCESGDQEWLIFVGGILNSLREFADGLKQCQGIRIGQNGIVDGSILGKIRNCAKQTAAPCMCILHIWSGLAIEVQYIFPFKRYILNPLVI